MTSLILSALIALAPANQLTEYNWCSIVWDNTGSHDRTEVEECWKDSQGTDLCRLYTIPCAVYGQTVLCPRSFHSDPTSPVRFARDRVDYRVRGCLGDACSTWITMETHGDIRWPYCGPGKGVLCFDDTGQIDCE